MNNPYMEENSLKSGKKMKLTDKLEDHYRMNSNDDKEN
jgi:hypothetical protein